MNSDSSSESSTSLYEYITDESDEEYSINTKEEVLELLSTINIKTYFLKINLEEMQQYINTLITEILFCLI